MTDQPWTLAELRQTLEDSILGELDADPDSFTTEGERNRLAWETADSCASCGTRQLLELAAERPDLATIDPGQPMGPETTVATIIAANLYQLLYSDATTLTEKWQTQQEEAAE